MGARALEATTLTNIGAVYKDIGQPQKALAFFNQALLISREVSDRTGEAKTLNNIGVVYSDIGQSQKALEFYNQALPIIREVGDHLGEAKTLNNIGGVYSSLRQPEKALAFFNQVLPILQEVGDRLGEAVTLNNIGIVYKDIGQFQKALAFYNQALPTIRQVSDRAGEATILNNIGGVYSDIRQPQKALAFYNQSLSISQKVGARALEATTLDNISLVYSNIGQLDKASTNLKQAVRITLEIRRTLTRDDRSEFLQTKRGTSIALVDLLIKQNQVDSAYEWANLATTADLIDYTRLINAKVANPDAQKALDEWNQQNQQLQLLRQRLQEKFFDTLSKEMRELEAKVNQLAEEISRRFPEVAELFETTPTNIAQLRATIPAGTTVIHPVLLTNVKNVPDTIALFVLTKDKLTVKQVPINPTKFDDLLTRTYAQLTNRFEDKYLDNLEELYNLLIPPLETEIQATQPKQLSIIATGKLRYLPFEALHNNKTNQYLIEKYIVSYLTRLSVRSLQAVKKGNPVSPKRILAFGNPVPKKPLELPSAETEVNSITKILSGSEVYIRDKATLDAFKIHTPRFPFIHLATHSCFQPLGCCLPGSSNCQKPNRVDLQPNTILFADKSFNIADAALLGLENIELITLSACQTALPINGSGKSMITDSAQPISGIAYLFERAGAQAVIANLWSIDDKVTQEIMVQSSAKLCNLARKFAACSEPIPRESKSTDPEYDTKVTITVAPSIPSGVSCNSTFPLR